MIYALMPWLFLIVALIGFFAGLYQGEKIGIRDTERRWSDAIARGAAERDRQRVNAE